MSQTSLGWKTKPTSPQTVLTNNEIKEKVLQFRSPKYSGQKQNGIIPKTSGQLLNDSPVKKAF